MLTWLAEKHVNGTLFSGCFWGRESNPAGTVLPLASMKAWVQHPSTAENPGSRGTRHNLSK